MNEKQMEVLEKAVEKYGKKAQVLQAVEELSELIVELSESNEEIQNPQVTKAIKSMAKLIKLLNKNINRGQNNIKDIILEIADVQIMLYELIIIYTKEDSDFGDKLLGAIEYKIQRLKKRMEV